MRITCPHCGGLSLAVDVAAPTTTVAHADAVGTAIALLRQIISESPAISARLTTHALDTIAGELIATRLMMQRNDDTLSRLQCDLMKNFENTRREIAKINKKNRTKLPRSKFRKRAAG